MVWIHGGGLSAGSSEESIFDFTELVQRGDIVAISVNHRLGALGYLHLREDLGDNYASSGNVGILDLVESLRWVRDNISEFGGDPNNVTVIGESGGGWKISILLAMPAARGLFHRAVLRSGVALGAHSEIRATHNARKLIAKIGLTRPDDVINIPVRDLIAAQHSMLSASAPFENLHWPVVDGINLHQRPVDAIRSGMSAGIPLLIGTTAHELAGPPHIDTLNTTDNQIQTLLRYVVPEHRQQLLEIYKSHSPTQNSHQVLGAICSGLMFRIPTIRLAESKISTGSADVYMYEFTQTNPDFDPPQSIHSWDTAFFFRNVSAAPAARTLSGAYQLADRVSDALLAFVRTGNPNHRGIPEWPPYTVNDRKAMLIGEEWETEKNAFLIECRAGEMIETIDFPLLG